MIRVEPPNLQFLEESPFAGPPFSVFLDYGEAKHPKYRQRSRAPTQPAGVPTPAPITSVWTRSMPLQNSKPACGHEVGRTGVPKKLRSLETKKRTICRDTHDETNREVFFMKASVPGPLERLCSLKAASR